jgi:hypothetical protein
MLVNLTLMDGDVISVNAHYVVTVGLTEKGQTKVTVKKDGEPAVYIVKEPPDLVCQWVEEAARPPRWGAEEGEGT